MSDVQRYPRRLIEIDLPIREISNHSRRERSIGPLSTLHTWWARRPLSACRAVTCAALRTDPADVACPPEFRAVAADEMFRWAAERTECHSAESYKTFNLVREHSSASALCSHPTTVRQALLHFIADFANWDNSGDVRFLETARALTAVAHYSRSLQDSDGSRDAGWPGLPRWRKTVSAIEESARRGARPLVLDPFAGGGSIPVESMRCGADVFASDLNPVPVLLNKVAVEYIPKYGQRLADAVRSWGQWMEREAVKQLAQYYPSNANSTTPIAYLWAKTVRCEGPACGAVIPMVRSPWLSKASGAPVRLSITPNKSTQPPTITVGLRTDQGSAASRLGGTVRRGSVTCPCCGFTIPRRRIETIAKAGDLGEKLLVVIATRAGHTGRVYRAAAPADDASFVGAAEALSKIPQDVFGSLPTIPEEPLPYLRSIFNVHVYGVTKWAQLFNARQLLTAVTFAGLVRRAYRKATDAGDDPQFATALTTLLAMAADRQINALNRTCYWNPTGQKLQAGFSRQAIPMFWDYCEANPFGGSVGSWSSMVDCVLSVFNSIPTTESTGSSEQASASDHPLPDDSVDAVVTDPPYYDAVPYADLSDFYYVWLKRMLGHVHPALFHGELAPKQLEVVQLAERNPAYAYKTKDNFERLMFESLAEARRVAKPGSVSVVVFAHQSTAGWEAMLSALVRAGWVVTASWPIDTEMPTRVRARDSAVLASSIHLACRPREHADGSIAADELGNWRDVLTDLPQRIHEWMPRLATEGVVGADAIFACIGPALEVFSRYSRVERANGQPVTLSEYLEHVWAAVSREALSMIFADPETAGLDADARLTAMWLWTIAAPEATVGEASESGEGSNSTSDTDEEPESKATGGYVLEFDAARKIAQGLGARLEELPHVVEVKGDTARLLPVAERTKHLFGGTDASPATRKPPKKKQRVLFEELEEVAEQQGWGDVGAPTAGATTLDRVHQAMILFAAGRGEALKRFLVDEGVGRTSQFWKLAQSLSALYPAGADEKRWVDGVLARKKGLGF